jgi:putative tryptophan/tyrosine transport system substrate-binding protein
VRRRDFVALLGVAVSGWSLSARADHPSKLYRLGYLSAARIPNAIDALQTGLRELGYIEGKNLKVEYRFGGRQSERLDAIASELVELRPDAIVTAGTPAVFAAKQATTTIPIVMAPVGDPVRYGIVASLAHPGGNITGVTLYRSELAGKRVEVLKEVLPAITRLGALGNAANPATNFGGKRRNWQLRRWGWSRRYSRCGSLTSLLLPSQRCSGTAPTQWSSRRTAC